MNPVLQAATTAATVKAVTSEREPRPVERKENPKTLQEAFLARPFTWTLVIGIGAFALYRIGKGVAKGLQPKPPTTEKEVKDEIRKMESTLRATYADSQYPGFADQLYAARHGNNVFGTDEDTIYRVLAQMKNNLDFAKLVQAFGKRRLSFSFTQGDLIAFLSDELSDSEVAACNSILAGNGITYRI